MGYDCSDPTKEAPYDRIDLTEVQRCADPELDYHPPEERSMQILQTESARPVVAYRCKATVDRSITKCGFNSITYGGIHLPRREYPLAAGECKKAVKTKQWNMEGQVLHLEVPARNTHTFFSQGGVDKEGNCQTASFVQDGILYTTSYQQVTVDLVIETVHGMLDPVTGKVKFSSGLIADYSDETIHDTLEGVLVWRQEHYDCQSTTSELYRGLGTLYRRKDNLKNTGRDALVIISNRGSNQYAGLLVLEPRETCGKKCYLTQIPNVRYCPLSTHESPLDSRFQESFEQGQAQLMAAMGAQHLTTNLDYRRALRQIQGNICQTTRQELINRVKDLAGAGNQQSLLDIYGRGTRFYLAGNVGYAVKCPARNVTLADARNCTLEIPVKDQGRHRWMDAQTGILQDFPTEIPCSHLMPVEWKLEGSWFCSTPEIIPCPAPHQLNVTVDPLQLGSFTEVMKGHLYTDRMRQEHKVVCAR